MQIPNPKIESRILGYLATVKYDDLRRFVNPRKIMDICLPSLLHEQQVVEPRELEELLYNMEHRELLERQQDSDFKIADKGYLQFKLSLDVLENVKKNKRLFDKIIDSSSSSNEIKKQIKSFLHTLIGKTNEGIIKNVVKFVA